MIRCDDIFVDSDVDKFEKVCQIIRRYDFDHLIGITPLGEGKRLCSSEWIRLWKLPKEVGFLFWKLNYQLPSELGFLINYRIEKMCGEKFIGDNIRLTKNLDNQFNEYEAIPALHGLHHYKYDSLPENKVYSELSTGKKMIQGLFKIEPEVFTAPFNAWNHKTELVCRSLNLSIDKCKTAFDMNNRKPVMEMSNSEIKRLAKQQSSLPEVLYHPILLSNLRKFELYLKTRRRYC